MLSREELEHVAREGLPVLYTDKVRGCRIIGQVTALIERYKRGCPILSAELRDMRANCCYICNPQELTVWEGHVDNSLLTVKKEKRPM